MEKIVSVLWKRDGQSDADFGASLRAEAQELAKAGAMRLRLPATPWRARGRAERMS